MEVTTYISHLNRPAEFAEGEIEQLKEICQKYPYFQSARALYLKGLHQQRSFLYNKELKRTAAYTTDRDMLFEFIISGDFINYRPINVQDIDVYGEDVFQVKKHEPTLNETIEKTVLETLVYIENSDKETELIHKIDAIAQKKVEAKQEIAALESEEVLAEEISEAIELEVEEFTFEKENSFIEAEESVDNNPDAQEVVEEIHSQKEEIIEELEEKLEIGQPLEFSENEKYSFTQWLQLTQMKPIEREQKPEPIQEISIEKTEPIVENIQTIEEPKLIKKQSIDELSTEKSTSIETQKLGNTSIEIVPVDKKNIKETPKVELIPVEEKSKSISDPKKKKLELIDRFIEANPKIVPSKTAPAPVINLEPTDENQPYFMTETLAKIYLEQKKYQKAIQAYEILILKYPEKSSLFADRISYIKELQQYNNL